MNKKKFRVRIWHSLPIEEYAKRNIGKLPLLIKEVQLGEGEVFCKLETSDGTLISIDKDLIELQSNDTQNLSLFSNSIVTLFDDIDVTDCRFQVTDYFEDSIEELGISNFNPILSDESSNYGLEIEMLGFSYSSGRYVSKIAISTYTGNFRFNVSTLQRISSLSMIEKEVTSILHYHANEVASLLKRFLKGG